MLRRLKGVIAPRLLAFPALCLSTSKHQVTIVPEVKSHQAAEDSAHRGRRVLRYLCSFLQEIALLTLSGAFVREQVSYYVAVSTNGLCRICELLLPVGSEAETRKAL
jgi:hypothetical protein